MNFLKPLKNWRAGQIETRVALAGMARKHGFQIGEYSYGRPKVRFAHAGTKLSIGRYCSIADQVEIFLGGNHRPEWGTTYPFESLTHWWPTARSAPPTHSSRGDVVIGSDVWIGSGALLLSGVTVGHGAVIGARSVISRDVPPYAVVAGNPAKLIRFRFDPETVAALLEAAWWDLPRASVEKLIPLLQSERIGDLIEAAKALRSASPRA